MSLTENENAQAKHVWDTNAAFWDERMGEGNDFFNILLWPAVEKLLKPERGERYWMWPAEMASRLAAWQMPRRA